MQHVYVRGGGAAKKLYKSYIFKKGLKVDAKKILEWQQRNCKHRYSYLRVLK